MEHIPLDGPFVTDEEAANLAAAREAQKAENAASEEEKRVLRSTRASSASTRSSKEKTKVSTRSSKGSVVKKTTPSKKKKNGFIALESRSKQDEVAEQDTTAMAEQCLASSGYSDITHVI